MKAVVLESADSQELALVERPDPEPGPGQLLVRLRAASLNYRDLVMLRGGKGSRQRKANLIPGSDAAGEVVAAGPGARRFAVGDRVTVSFFQHWIAGNASREKLESSLGSDSDGILCELRAFDEDGLVATPDSLSDVEAATLPCAGLTAWSAVVDYGAAQPGDMVLIQGTGGVALFALQFAKLCGAQAIITSSSDAKLERARGLGADHLINYVDDAEWGRTALKLTGGRGVDNVIELGGAGTLKQSLWAVRTGGVVCLIGVLGGAREELLIPLIGSRNIRLQGLAVGSRDALEAMMRAMTLHQIKPVVDRVFPLAEAGAAFEHLAAGRHFGKICIEL